MIKPKRLNKGSRIAIISPCGGSPYIFPGIYNEGLKNMRELLGLETVEYPTACMHPDKLYANPEIRAEDINNAFSDTGIDGIICTIGGYESARILKYLDLDAILANPKLIMGYSDAATFLTYLNNHGLVTFYGPSVMSGFAQLRHLPDSYMEHLKQLLFSNPFPYTYRPYKRWTNGYKDWGNKDTIGECTEFYDNTEGWHFLQGDNYAEGKLWGGCIEVLEFLKGTDYWPDRDFWNGRILFFETSEDKPLPFQVGYMLRNYGLQGILNKVGGIMFGRPKDYSVEQKKELDKLIIDIVDGEFKASKIPVVSNVDFGHTAPKLILPLGCKAGLDPHSGSITLLESPFAL